MDSKLSNADPFGVQPSREGPMPFAVAMLIPAVVVLVAAMWFGTWRLATLEAEREYDRVRIGELMRRVDRLESRPAAIVDPGPL